MTVRLVYLLFSLLDSGVCRFAFCFTFVLVTWDLRSLWCVLGMLGFVLIGLAVWCCCYRLLVMAMLIV